MFPNIFRNTSINNINNFQLSDIKHSQEHRSKPMYKIDDLRYGETRNEHPIFEKGYKMKTAVAQSQISPAESLDSVGSVTLSSIDEGNHESSEDKQVFNIR